MSSNIRVIRICKECNQEFVAKTTVTKYCSNKCRKKASKTKVRDYKVDVSNQELEAKTSAEIAKIKAKEYISVKEAAMLLGCSKVMIYKMINNDRLKATNLSERKTIIKMSDIKNLFN